MLKTGPGASPAPHRRRAWGRAQPHPKIRVPESRVLCTAKNQLRKSLASPSSFFLHTRPLSSPPPGAPRKNEALARAERAWPGASLSIRRRRRGPRAPSRLPHLRGRPLSLEPGSPWRHIPRDSRSVTPPTRRATARGNRGGKGAAEGGAAAPRRLPRPDTKRSAPPRHLFPPGPRGWGAPPGGDPTSARGQVSPPRPSQWPRALPRRTPPRCRGESNSGRRGPGAAREPRAATHPGARELLPGSLRSAVGGRPQAPAPETSGAAARARGGSESEARIPSAAPASAQPGSPAPAREQPLRSPPASGRWAARKRPMGTPRAGWLHGPPTSEPPGRVGAAGAERRSLLLSAQRPGLARSLCRAPPAPPHSPHAHAQMRPAQPRTVGAPPVTRGRAARFGCVPGKRDS